MKPEEASVLLEMAVPMTAVTQQGFERFLQARKMAVDALEKQIPVKPNSFEAQWCVYTCPKCGIMLDEPIGRNRIPKWKKVIAYCEECGQAIDWSDYETD